MSLFSDTQELINDSGVFWPNQQVYDALNESMLEVWQDLELHTGTATMTATASAESVAIPATILSPKSITYGGLEWFITNRTQRERWSNKWKNTSAGFPKHWVIFDGENLEPYPKPDVAYAMIIRGIVYPTEEITSGNLDIVEDKKIKRAIMWKAAVFLAEHTRPDLVHIWNQEAGRALREADKILGRNLFGRHIKRLRPSGRTNVAHQGDIAFGRVMGTRTG